MTKAAAKAPAKKKAELDIAEVQRCADAVLAEELYWFPVRHHSPAVAKHLRAAMRERKPKLVLIEGPAHATELIKHVIDSKTKPPVAIYSSFRDDSASPASPAPRPTFRRAFPSGTR